MSAARKKAPLEPVTDVPAHCVKCGRDFRLRMGIGADGFAKIPTAGEIAAKCPGENEEGALHVGEVFGLSVPKPS